MPTKPFRVRYQLQSLETKSSPLFSNIRAYLLTDSIKRLFCEATAIKDRKIFFQSSLEEEIKDLPYSTKKIGFETVQVTVLLQFGAEDRFIRMGEVRINISDILNHARNGQILPYKIQKCYDRNAKIHFGVTFWQAEEVLSQRRQEVSHSRSHCYLPLNNIRTRTKYERNQFNATEYSQFTDRQDQDELSVISDKFNHGIAKTLNKTELFKPKVKVPNNQQIIDLKTENRIYQHQIAQLQLKLRQSQEENDGQRDLIDSCRQENYKLQAQVGDLEREIKERENSRQNVREQLNAQVSRVLRLYQESEQQRNKLLVQREEAAAQRSSQLKEGEKRFSEESARVKSLQRNEQTLKEKIEEYMSQIGIYEKALRTEERTKQKIAQTLEVERRQIQKILIQNQNLKEESQKFRKTKDQLQSQLQISTFTLSQLQKQSHKLKKTTKQQTQLLSQYQSQLKLSTQTIKTQRSNFMKKLQQIQSQTQLQQQTKQAYLEQLQIKTINQNSKNSYILSLKKQLTRIKNQIVIQHEKNEELKSEINLIRNSKLHLEERIEDYQARIMVISKQNAVLEAELASLRNQVVEVEQSQQKQGILQLQREELIAQCYEQRDQVWKKQIDKLQHDTHLLMQKSKREKEDYQHKLIKCAEELTSSQENQKKTKYRLKEANEELDELKKIIKQQEGKLVQLEREKGEFATLNSKLKLSIKQLQEKIASFSELEQQQQEIEKALRKAKQEGEKRKSQMEKEQAKVKKIRDSLKEMINSACSYLGKSEKQRIFYSQLKIETIDTDILLLFNSTAKLYTERHNRIRAKLDEFEQVKAEIESRERDQKRVNHSFNQEGRSHAESSDSKVSRNESQSHQQYTARITQLINKPSLKVKSHKDESELRNLRREIEELKGKLRKEIARFNEFQRETEMQRQKFDETCEALRRSTQENESCDEQLSQVRQKLKMKENQLQSTREQLKESNRCIDSLKKELEEATRAFKLQKSSILKRSPAPHSHHFQKSSEDSARTFQLEKKLKNTQEELEKLRRQSDDRKSQNAQGRQIKSLQSRLMEKEEAITALREGLDEQRERGEQLKELQSLKMRKLKEEFEEELEGRLKSEKELSKSLGESEERFRQAQKKLRLAEEGLRSANVQLAGCAEREEKQRKLLVNECQLKVKTLEGEKEAQVMALSKRIEEGKAAERASREEWRRKDREIAELRGEVERSGRAVLELRDKLELCGVRLKNMEAEESNYKEVIGVLEEKMRAESISDRRGEGECEFGESRSNFSLKAFTFR